jgi:HEAT repeat protein
MADDQLASLLSALNNPKTRENAIIDLGNLRDNRAIESLSRQLLTQDHSHAFSYRPRKLAAEALGKIGDAGAIPALLIAVEDNHSVVRNAVADALGKVGDASVMPALMTMLKDESVEVRQTAAVALGELGGHNNIPLTPFLDLLADHSDDLRVLGRKIFVELGEHGAETLMVGLTHPNSTIRGACAEILGQIKSEKAYSALKKASTTDTSKWVRGRAQASLALLPKPTFDYPTVNRNTIPPPSDTLQTIRDQKADWSNLRSRSKLPPLPPIPTMPPQPVKPPVEMIDPEAMTAEQIKDLLDQLDVKLAKGEISEVTYHRLHTRWEKRLNEKE